MKTAEELNALKEEMEKLNAKLAELNEEELAQISGGFSFDDNGIVLEPGDSFDFVNDNGRRRFRVENHYAVDSTLMSVWVQVYALIGSSVTHLYYGEMAVGQLFLMTYAGRYAEDGKTKIG